MVGTPRQRSRCIQASMPLTSQRRAASSTNERANIVTQNAYVCLDRCDFHFFDASQKKANDVASKRRRASKFATNLPDLTDAHNASIKLAPSNDSVDNVVADAVQPRRSSRKRKGKNKSSDDD